MTNYVRSLHLVDVNGQNLAEILMPENVNGDMVLLMPRFGMFAHAQIDASLPHVRNGPYRMTAESFLGYLAGIAANSPEDLRLGMTLEGTGPDKMHHVVVLARSMQADEIAALTGIALDDVRHFLACHLTFKALPADNA